MKKRIKLKKLNIIALIHIIVSIVFIVSTIKLNVIPMKYLSILIVIMLTINILGIVLINLKKKAFKILGIIIFIISMIISCISSYYLYHSVKFLDTSFENVEKVNKAVYYIITQKDNPDIDSLEELTGNICYYRNTDNIEKVLDKIENKVILNQKLYEDISPMFKDIENRQEAYMVIDKTTYDVVFELDKTLHKENYKVVSKIELKIKNKVDKVESKEAFNLYIGGTDFTQKYMDFNMLVTVNTKTKKVLLTSIPRDYYIEQANTNGQKNTLSYMGAYGIQTNQQSLSKFFDTPIDYYMKINTQSLVELVDVIGGINYCSDVSFKTTHALVLNTYDDTKGRKLYVKRGCQQLNGIETLTVARERMAFPGRDRVRQENCRKIMMAILDKLKSTNTITNYNSILNSVSNFYETTMPKEVITKMVKQTINGETYKIEKQSMNGSDVKGYVHLTTLKDWVMNPEEAGVVLARENIKKVLK